MAQFQESLHELGLQTNNKYHFIINTEWVVFMPNNSQDILILKLLAFYIPKYSKYFNWIIYRLQWHHLICILWLNENRNLNFLFSLSITESLAFKFSSVLHFFSSNFTSWVNTNCIYAGVRLFSILPSVKVLLWP